MIKKLSFVFFFFAVASLYLHNLTGDIYSGDIGDLVTASYVAGVAHPPGYPLFTFLGFLMTKIPFAIPVVTKVALVSLFASLGALIVYSIFALRVTKSTFLTLLSTAILAFSYLFWFHAEIPEVFGLNNFFVVSIITTAYFFHREKQTVYLCILGFLCGLALTHHHTILFLFPGIILILFRHLKFIFSDIKRVGFGFLSFFLGLLPYAYVPIAASQNPIINWDNAQTMHNFIHLVLRKDYGFAPSIVNHVPLSVKMIHVSSFFTSLVHNFSYQVLLLTGIGIIELFRKDRWFLSGLTIAFILTGPFFMYYAAGLTGVPVGMGIIERFYVMPSIVLMFYVPFGFMFLKQFLDARLSRPGLSLLLLSYFLIIPVMLLYYNFPRTDLSNTTIGNTLADNIFSYVPKDSVLFVSGDTTTFNIWYNHYVLNKRADIGLINPPGIGGNKFFEDAINEYFKEHPDATFTDIPSETIEALRKQKRIFATYPIDFTPEGTLMLPRGLVYEMVAESQVPPYDVYLTEVEEHLRNLQIVRKETLSPAEDNLVAAEIPSIYASGLVRIADFVDAHYKDPGRAEHYYRRALWIDPDHPSAYAGLALSQYKAYRDCRNAPESMKQAIELYPVWKTYYAQLYLIYDGCEAPEDVKDDLARTYETLFNEDLRAVTAPHRQQ